MIYAHPRLILNEEEPFRTQWLHPFHHHIEKFVLLLALDLARAWLARVEVISIFRDMLDRYQQVLRDSLIAFQLVLSNNPSITQNLLAFSKFLAPFPKSWTTRMLQLWTYCQFQELLQETYIDVLPFQPFVPFWILTLFFSIFLQVIYFLTYQGSQEFSSVPTLLYSGVMEFLNYLVNQINED